jgi:hypothetical protein
MEDTYSDVQDTYSELELEPNAVDEPGSGFAEDMDNIEEVEPIAEFDEPVEEEHALEPVMHESPMGGGELELDMPTQEAIPEEEEAVFTVEEPVISVPIVPLDAGQEAVSAHVEPPEIEPAVAPEEPAPPMVEVQQPVISEQPVEMPGEPEQEIAVALPVSPAVAGPAFTYDPLVGDIPELSALLRKLEQQIASDDCASALATARAAYDYLLHRLFPESLALDGTETSRILALDVKFRRFVRFKSMLWAEPDRKNLLFVHHFLYELYFSVKEL